LGEIRVETPLLPIPASRIPYPM
jgi:hypothetical protein